eukprot:CAMPEP_0182870660 /NCGR_PEP_ID=MMETSP0034_2-20130328/10661_1 /TAXON_ID=156128 /ORGANISM="Nephroselmis pyriformis, Strain CCMP717" /LENGTH=445 /DNA_ID=CAMNT_0025003173 /DNA_START=331 /DNA_END=1668 /DNA_ORIENTATION=+
MFGGTSASNHVAMAVIFYCFCSASMLVVNKVAIVYFPYPTTLLAIQFIASAIVPKALGSMGVLDCDPLEIKKVVPFLKAVFVFFGTLFTSMKALQVLNVDTVTVFRSSLPLAVAFGDYLFLQRQLPSLQTWVSLLMTLAGSIAFIFKETKDNRFDTQGALGHYFWGIMYWLFMVADQLVLKHIVDGGPKLTTWGRVYYQNALSLLPAMILSLALGEASTLATAPVYGRGGAKMDLPTFMAVGASCVVGCGISFSGFLLRKYVSALSFTVIGVVNKLASVAINTLIWDKHAGMEGLGALCVCVLGATLYRQPEKKGAPGAVATPGEPSPLVAWFRGLVFGPFAYDIPTSQAALMHAAALMTPKRVTVFVNGGGAGIGNGGVCMHLPESGWEMFKQVACSNLRLSCPPLTARVFNAKGGEISDVTLLRDDEVLYISNGEPFRKPAEF